MIFTKLISRLAIAASLLPMAFAVHAQPRACQELAACIQQTECENQNAFGNTEERRKACISRCTKSIDACNEKKNAEASQEDKMRAAGGKPLPICPENYSFTGHPKDQDRFGNYKCFASAADTVPASFKCPAGMEVHIPPGSKGMMMCRWK